MTPIPTICLGRVPFPFQFQGEMGMPQFPKTQSLLSPSIQLHSDSTHVPNMLGDMAIPVPVPVHCDSDFDHELNAPRSLLSKMKS